MTVDKQVKLLDSIQKLDIWISQIVIEKIYFFVLTSGIYFSNAKRRSIFEANITGYRKWVEHNSVNSILIYGIYRYFGS